MIVRPVTAGIRVSRNLRGNSGVFAIELPEGAGAGSPEEGAGDVSAGASAGFSTGGSSAGASVAGGGVASSSSVAGSTLSTDFTPLPPYTACTVVRPSFFPTSSPDVDTEAMVGSLTVQVTPLGDCSPEIGRASGR